LTFETEGARRGEAGLDRRATITGPVLDVLENTGVGAVVPATLSETMPWKSELRTPRPTGLEFEREVALASERRQQDARYGVQRHGLDSLEFGRR